MTNSQNTQNTQNTYTSARQEMKRAWLETIASRLNPILLKEAVNRDSLRKPKDEVMDLLSSAMKRISGFNLKEIPEYGAIYADFGESGGETIIYDGKFFVVNDLDNQLWYAEKANESNQGKIRSLAEEIGARQKGLFDTVNSATPAGKVVYIGDSRYYVCGTDVFSVSLFSWDDVVERDTSTFDLNQDAYENGLPITKYTISIEDFHLAVTSNTLNKSVIEKIGFTEREPSVPYVPKLLRENGIYYSVGNRVFLDSDSKSIIVAIGNGRVWHMSVVGIRLRNSGAAYVNTEQQEEFERKFFSNLLNLAIVRRHKPRNIFDLAAERNKEISNTDAAPESQNTTCSHENVR